MNPALIFVLIVLVVGGLFDLWLGATRGGAATISWSLYTLSKRYPTVAFAAGYLCGHIFGSMGD